MVKMPLLENPQLRPCSPATMQLQVKLWGLKYINRPACGLCSLFRVGNPFKAWGSGDRTSSAVVAQVHSVVQQKPRSSSAGLLLGGAVSREIGTT